jgi:hypothetical protein
MNHFLRLNLALFLAMVALAAHGAECDSPDAARRTVDGLQANIASIKAEQKRQQAEMTAEINAITKKMLDEERWTKIQTSKIYMDIMQSPEYSAFEKKKMAAVEVLVEAARSYAGAMKQNDLAAACPQARAMLFSQSAIAGFNAKQFTFMRDGAKKAAARALKAP